MTAKSAAVLTSELTANLASAQPGGMTAAELRAVVQDIVDSYLNKTDTPITEGAWIPFTPTIGAATGTITTLGALDCAYARIGKTIIARYSIAITTNGSGAGYVTTTLPFALADGNIVFGYGREAGVSAKMLQVFWAGGLTIGITDYAAVYPGANGAVIDVTVIYQAA